MTTTFKGSKIVSNFRNTIQAEYGKELKPTSISRQVFELKGERNCLLYVKARSAHPIRWGVTKNVIDRLKNQNFPWCVILLFLTHESGYLLSMDDVDYYIKTVWPLGADGDYKPSEGSCLSRNRPFNSLLSVMEELKRI
jgi:hypothetical protein